MVHEMNDHLIKVLKDVEGKLKRCQEWTAQREALVATPTIEEIANIQSGKGTVRGRPQ